MKVYAISAIGTDGLEYSVRLLLDQEELEGLRSAGIIPEASELVGSEPFADSLIAGLEKQMHKACGGLTQ